MKNFQKKLHKTSSQLGGFTLIETLIAITVLILSITGPLQIAANSLFSAFYARDQITAYFLAEEAIEYIKNARDTTFLQDVFNNGGGSDWLAGLGACINSNPNTFKGCYVDALESFGSSPDAIVACDSAGCPKIKYYEATGLWGYKLGTNTKFTRTVEVIPEPNSSSGATINGEEAIIKVKVTWPTQSFLGPTKSFELVGSMTNWQRK